MGRLFRYDKTTEGYQKCTYKSINPRYIENTSNKHLETNERTFVNTGRVCGNGGSSSRQTYLLECRFLRHFKEPEETG